MVIQEVKDYQRDRRIELAKNITELLIEFSNDTGLTVSDIRIIADRYFSGKTEYYTVDVEVRL